MLISFAQLLNAMHPAPFFDDTNAFFNADEIKKGGVSILLKFIADMGRAFPLAFRLLNLDRYTFPIRITIETSIQVAKYASLQHKKNKFSEKVPTFRINLKTLKSANKSKNIEKCE